MTSQNVAIVRRLHEAFNRRDIAALLADLDPNVEWRPIMSRLEGSVYRGPDQVATWLAELDRDWAEFRTEPQEFRDLGEAVLGIGTWHARARTSGLTLDSQPGAWLTEIRDGKVVRHETFTDRAQAFEAAGL